MKANDEEPPQQLPTTSYAVLGLLMQGELSGYDVLKLTQRGIRFFVWSPSKSQIYFELRRLLSRGYVAEREVEQTGRPDKRLFKITKQGELALRQWLNRPAQSLDISTLLLKVYFGRFMAPDALVSHIEQFRLKTQATLGHYEEVERRISNIDDAFFPYLTLKSGLLHARADLRWADEVLLELDKRTTTQEENDVPLSS